MKSYYFNFNQSGEVCKYKSSLYAKEDVFALLKKLLRKYRLKSKSMQKLTSHVVFSYVVSSPEGLIKIRLHLSKKDAYYKKLKRIYRKCQLADLFLGIFGIGSAILLLSSLVKLESPEVPSQDIDILDTLLETYIEKEGEFSSSQEGVFMTFVDNHWFQETEDVNLEKISPYISLFDLEKTLSKVFEDTYELENQEVIHQEEIEKYYDEKTKNINKEAVTAKISQNIDMFEEPFLHVENLTEEELEKLAEGELEKLTEEEIEYIVNSLYQYIELMKVTGTEYDINEFACFVSHLRLYKNSKGNKDKTFVYAYTNTNGKIVWNTFQEIPICSDKWYLYNQHEFSHIRQTFCQCLEKTPVFPFANSITLTSHTYSAEDLKLQPYEFDFYEEATAERETLRLNGQNYNVVQNYVYLNEQIIFNCIEYALSVNPEYHLYDSVNATMNHSPIQFYQSFPYLFDEEEVEDYIAMLQCYNVVLEHNKEDYEEVCEKNHFSLEYEDELLTYAEAKNIELFYKNLVISHEKYKDQVPLEELLQYEYHLIYQFTIWMQNANIYVFDKNKDNLAYLLSEAYENYISYLSSTHENIDSKWKETTALYFPFIEFPYPSFVEEEKKEFYDCFSSEPVKVYEK